MRPTALCSSWATLPFVHSCKWRWWKRWCCCRRANLSRALRDQQSTLASPLKSPVSSYSISSWLTEILIGPGAKAAKPQKSHIQKHMWMSTHLRTHTHTHTLFRPQDLYNSEAQCFWYLLTAWLTVEYWASDITSSPETIEETAELFYPTAVHWTQSIHTWKWSSYISRHRISVYCLCVQYTIWHYSFMFWTVINSVTPKEALCSNK